MSHYMTPGDETIVTLEMADGTVYRGKAHCVSLSMRQEVEELAYSWDRALNREPTYRPGLPEWDIQLQGFGALNYTQGEVRQYVKRQRTSREWSCEYCGAVMPKAERKCGGCGAWRSFLYDV